MFEIDGTRTRILRRRFRDFRPWQRALSRRGRFIPCRTRCRFYRGQNEQSMGFCRGGPTPKYHLRRRFMFCTASAGPGTANLLTASALAHANRLPMLDALRRHVPDAPAGPRASAAGAFRQSPRWVLNDAFKAVTRYWDRITHPAQVIQTLPAALATMLRPRRLRTGLHRAAAGCAGLGLRLPPKASSRRARIASAARPPMRTKSRPQPTCSGAQSVR